MKLLLERQAATAAKRICILKAGDSVYAVGKAEIISSRSGTGSFRCPGPWKLFKNICAICRNSHHFYRPSETFGVHLLTLTLDEEIEIPAENKQDRFVSRRNPK
uniref:GH02369p1 n=1 Tax=Drosophila melanogaster TaxID=7227 RepID=G7H825_DROME|nr:GH02369p1 [Drosophila melanogaster]